MPRHEKRVEASMNYRLDVLMFHPMFLTTVRSARRTSRRPSELLGTKQESETTASDQVREEEALLPFLRASEESAFNCYADRSFQWSVSRIRGSQH